MKEGIDFDNEVFNVKMWVSFAAAAEWHFVLADIQDHCLTFCDQTVEYGKLFLENMRTTMNTPY